MAVSRHRSIDSRYIDRAPRPKGVEHIIWQCMVVCEVEVRFQDALSLQTWDLGGGTLPDPLQTSRPLVTMARAHREAVLPPRKFSMRANWGRYHAMSNEPPLHAVPTT